jgi:methanogenic corrinoid protein MtbC1
MELSQRPSLASQGWHDDYAKWLASYASTPAGYDPQRVLDALEAGRMTADDLILHCIPQASRLLGESWNENALPFALVSLGSARLYGLCKMATEEWGRTNPLETGASVLLVTLESEDHVIGPTVLAYLLRRNGHSVRLMMQVNASSIVDMLDVGCFDGLMISCSTGHTVAHVAQAVNHVRARSCTVPPILLGGALLAEADGLKEKTGVDLVTNDLNSALSHIGVFVDQPPVATRVAE